MHNLHSTMLLLYTSETKGYIEPFVFTFHYASTILSCAKTDRAVIVIYIPLCFYFILAHCLGKLKAVPFTFHYASTLSASSSRFRKRSSKFTLHYASTLSKMELVQIWNMRVIYIPLCFYFIADLDEVRKEIMHLHSTMLLLY